MVLLSQLHMSGNAVPVFPFVLVVKLPVLRLLLCFGVPEAGFDLLEFVVALNEPREVMVLPAGGSAR